MCLQSSSGVLWITFSPDLAFKQLHLGFNIYENNFKCFIDQNSTKKNACITITFCAVVKIADYFDH